MVQIRIGAHSFTFDHVYGSRGAPSSAMFEECISPLIDGLFQGYNATVLAYGQVISIMYRRCCGLCVLSFYFNNLHVHILQTGSGKTYTMGTGSGDGCQTGLIPKVMNALFSKIDILKHQTEFQLQVSFIEVHS